VLHAADERTHYNRAACAVPNHRIVSATDQRKYDDPPGLQDNGEIALNWLAGAWMVVVSRRALAGVHVLSGRHTGVQRARVVDDNLHGP
jgi:hypothetical protein